MTLKNQDRARRIIELLQDSEEESGEKIPGRRQFDDPSKKLVAYGIGGGSAIGVLISVFTFMNSAPWAAKSDVATNAQNIQRVEDQLKVHVDGPGHATTNAQVELLRAQLTTMNDKLADIKADLKDLKDRNNGTRK